MKKLTSNFQERKSHSATDFNIVLFVRSKTPPIFLNLQMTLALLQNKNIGI